jgi:small conductance mechanosensitive channel
MKLNPVFFENFSSLAIFLLFIVGTLILGYLFRRFFKKFVINSSRLMNNDPTNYKFLGHVIAALIYIVGFSWGIYETKALKTVATSLLAGAGILAVAIGFASQQALGNLVSGIMIVIFKPFHVNDRLTIRGIFSGVVEDITLRHTIIRDFENKRIIVPNMVISNEILINADFDDPAVCRFIEFPFDFNENLEKVKEILTEVIVAHPDFIDKRTEEEMARGDSPLPIKLVKILEYGVLIRAYAWASDNGKAFQLASDVTEEILKKLKAQGVSIAVPKNKIAIENE